MASPGLASPGLASPGLASPEIWRASHGTRPGFFKGFSVRRISADPSTPERI
ncbi:MAG: hypothetical protein GVY09_14120 [Gammaproteobacteria bacterium]|nr:hypothetical protein [Gammaproteobacteria bacterium]